MFKNMWGKGKLLFSSYRAKTVILFFAILFVLISASGCTDVNSSYGEVELVEVVDSGQIDDALMKGPVVLKLGSKGCIPCEKQEEVLSEIVSLYPDSASVLLVDVKENPELAGAFGVSYIPDTCVIAGLENGSYVYIRQDGSASLDRNTARFIGLADKATLTETLDHAIEFREER